MRVKLVSAIVLSVTAGLTFGQTNPVVDEFKEIEIPPPPAYGTEGLVPIDTPASSSLKYGLDPATLSIGSDDVVRYVMVAYNPTGSVNGLFEGLRCASGEVKTYARSSGMGRWTMVQQPKWRPFDTSPSNRHALSLSKLGVCDGWTVATRSAPDMIRLLRYPRKVDY
jgi:hypothetical protein